jgi:hypothetical protein
MPSCAAGDAHLPRDLTHFVAIEGVHQSKASFKGFRCEVLEEGYRGQYKSIKL